MDNSTVTIIIIIAKRGVLWAAAGKDIICTLIIILKFHARSLGLSEEPLATSVEVITK